jgi:hypothetical protein
MKPLTQSKTQPTPAIPPAALAELQDYLRQSGSTLSPAEAISDAIKLWIARDRDDAAPMRGYQWKQLFLPDATRLRVHMNNEWHIAEVSGDDLIYEGRAVSPNQMVQQVTGGGRNAWRELWIRFPGEKTWVNAASLRTRQSKQAATPPLSPADAMAAAAKSMSVALSTALTLVEHASHQAQNTLERRLPRYRREIDQMDDIH